MCSSPKIYLMVKIFKKQLQVKRARYVSWNQEIEAPRREILFISSIPTNKGISVKNFNKLLISSNPRQHFWMSKTEPFKGWATRLQRNMMPQHSLCGLLEVITLYQGSVTLHRQMVQNLPLGLNRPKDQTLS